MAKYDFETKFSRIVADEELIELDPIEQAAGDFRMVKAARFILFGERDDHLGGLADYGDLLHQIGGEYQLCQAEVRTATEIAEDRESRDNQK